MTNDRTTVLQAIKNGGIPMLVSMGDADEAGYPCRVSLKGVNIDNGFGAACRASAINHL